MQNGLFAIGKLGKPASNCYIPESLYLFKILFCDITLILILVSSCLLSVVQFKLHLHVNIANCKIHEDCILTATNHQ